MGTQSKKRRSSARFALFQLFLIAFFLQYLCMAPDVGDHSIESASQVTVCQIHQLPEAYLDKPISVNNAEVQTAQYFLMWGFYFIKSTNHSCEDNLIVFSNQRSFPKHAEIKVFGKLRSFKIGGMQFLFIRERQAVPGNGYAVSEP